MPLTIIEKPKTKATCIDKHPNFVPLRVHSFSTYHGDTPDKLKESVEVGDIVIGMEHYGPALNVTKGRLIDTKHLDKVFVVRAYDIAQIILTNDNDPAPVV